MPASPAAVNGAAGAMISPRARLQALCDPGSLQIIRSSVMSDHLGDRARPGDGVVGASGTVAGRPIFCFAQDGGFVGGALGVVHAETIVRVLHLAADAKTPVVGFFESAGARIQEGSAALGGYGRVFRATVEISGRVPQISIVTGTCAGGGSYSPALTDFVVMTRDATMFLTGPGVVREVTGEELSAHELGGRRVHRRNGVVHLIAEDDRSAATLARTLLSYLPQSSLAPAPVADPVPALNLDPSEAVPEESRRIYDVREVLAGIIDGHSFFELAPRWARNMVTGFARLEGRPVGVVANQPRYLGGVIDSAGSQKAARFIRTCNSFGMPLIVLVDTPGFMPGLKQELEGIIRHGAKLLHAFAEATVPRVTVVLRQAFGGACIAMNSKDLGADLTFAWPGARVGIVGARQAVGIVNRREIGASDDPAAERDRLAEAYAHDQQDASVAAQAGLIDEVVHPFETRSRLAGALAALERKPRTGGGCGNIPL
jgi:acetyl-CoA carboxylase carboxyltransferase component